MTRHRAMLPIVLAAALVAGAPAEGADRDTVAAARELYNAGQYDLAIEAASLAGRRADQANAAALVLARARLERFREQLRDIDLTEGRRALQAIDLNALSARDRLEYLVGLAELQYFDGRFGAAAELFGSALGSSPAEAGEAGRDRLLDWWAAALDRRAREIPGPQATYARMLERMEDELRERPGSAVAAYWIPAAAHGAGDLPRAWDAAIAAWVRAALTGDRAEALRADVDRLVRDLLIPELGRAAGPGSTRDADALRAEWNAVTDGWTAP